MVYTFQSEIHGFGDVQAAIASAIELSNSNIETVLGGNGPGPGWTVTIFCQEACITSYSFQGKTSVVIVSEDTGPGLHCLLDEAFSRLAPDLYSRSGETEIERRLRAL